jgi:hypothetical protein
MYNLQLSGGAIVLSHLGLSSGKLWWILWGTLARRICLEKPPASPTGEAKNTVGQTIVS